MAAPLGACLGWLVGGVLRVRRRHVEHAMERAGIERRVAPAMYASLGAGLLELLWLAGRPPAALDGVQRATPRAERALAEAHALGRGVVVATALAVNWDLCACAAARWIAARGAGRLHVITKRLSWRALDDYWQALRAERGVVLHDARGAWRGARAALAGGGVVALLVDQVPERASGVAALPFLGAIARHDLAAATLAARAGAPILVALARRDADGLHTLDVVEVLEPPASHRASLLDATARIAAALERFVRAEPAQWLWMHRRWKLVGASSTGQRLLAEPRQVRGLLAEPRQARSPGGASQKTPDAPSAGSNEPRAPTVAVGPMDRSSGCSAAESE
ncbi:MAG: lysophospholipid acyltransferase family protein [Polyangiaceae bacterium]